MGAGTLLAMTPIPGEPHKRSSEELTSKDGKKVTITIPGMPPRAKPTGTEERGAAEPPRDDPRPPLNPNHAPG